MSTDSRVIFFQKKQEKIIPQASTYSRTSHPSHTQKCGLELAQLLLRRQSGSTSPDRQEDLARGGLSISLLPSLCKDHITPDLHLSFAGITHDWGLGLVLQWSEESKNKNKRGINWCVEVTRQGRWLVPLEESNELAIWVHKAGCCFILLCQA